MLSGETNILVATDIASRGLDTTKVIIINTDITPGFNEGELLLLQLCVTI